MTKRLNTTLHRELVYNFAEEYNEVLEPELNNPMLVSSDEDQ